MAQDLGPEVALLARDAGTWDAEVTVRTGPGAPALPSRGVWVGRMACGGRWLVADFENETGFQGHGVYGWDAARGCYVSTWVDNTRGFLVVATGQHDAERRTTTYHHEASSPDGRTVRWREETRQVDDDTRELRQLFPGPDGDVETLSVVYRRRRGG